MAGPLGGKGRRVATRAELWDALHAAHADEASWHLIEIMIPRGPCPRPWCKSTVMIRAAAARICQAAGMAVGLTSASSLKRARVSRLM